MPENRQKQASAKRKKPKARQPQKRNRTSFKEGQSGNPGGRPKGLGEFRELVRDRLTVKALEALERHLAKKMRGGAVVRAAVEALSFGWGKPTQAVEVSGVGGAPVAVKAEVANAEPNVEQLSALGALLARVGAIPAGGGAGPAGAAADAEAHEVRSAESTDGGPAADGSSGGVPPPSGT